MNPEQIAAIIAACLEQGFVQPICLCAVSVNGCVLAMRYDFHEASDSWEPTLLAETASDGVFILPINMMVTDARGEAVRVVIRFDGWGFADLN